MIKVIAFDVFGTVFDLSGVERSEIKDYADHIRKPEWSPLNLPESWKTLPAHPDAAEGISKLRERFMVVTCSNGPVSLLTELSKHNQISWDMIIPIELNKVYKPNHKAYLTICEVMGVHPDEVLMVTANEYFGDLEASKEVGMSSILIRKEGHPMTISALDKVI